MDPVALVTQGFEAFVGGDLERLGSFLHERVEWRAIDYGPWDAEDREQVMDVIADRLEEGWRVELEECLDAGGGDVLIGLRAAGMEPARTVEDSDGRTFAVDRYFTIARYFAVVTIRDGRVVRVQDFPDRALALAATALGGSESHSSSGLA